MYEITLTKKMLMGKKKLKAEGLGFKVTEDESRMIYVTSNNNTIKVGMGKTNTDIF